MKKTGVLELKLSLRYLFLDLGLENFLLILNSWKRDMFLEVSFFHSGVQCDMKTNIFPPFLSASRALLSFPRLFSHVSLLSLSFFPFSLRCLSSSFQTRANIWKASQLQEIVAILSFSELLYLSWDFVFFITILFRNLIIRESSFVTWNASILAAQAFLNCTDQLNNVHYLPTMTRDVDNKRDKVLLSFSPLFSELSF